MTYNPKYTPAAIEEHSATPNISGRSPQENLRIEERNQARVATNPEWLLARKINGDREDSRQQLEALGFTVSDGDELFFKVIAPDGWTKETSGYWTTVKDKDGNEQISQFFKGAWYDRDAFLNFS